MALIKPLGYNPSRAKSLLEARELSGMILTSNDNVFYSTGIPVTRGQQNPILFALSNKYPPYAVVDSNGMPLPIVWAGAIGHHELWTKEFLTSLFPNGTTEELLTLIEQKFQSGARIGIESSMPHQLAEVIRDKIRGIEFVIIDDLIDELRLTKTEAEISRLKESLQITEKVEGAIFSEIRSDWSVFKLASRSKQLIYEYGGTGVDHATVSIGRSNPEILEDLKGAPGDIIVLDVGAILDGYVSDTRRLGHIGAVPEDLADLNNVMTDIVVETGEKSLKPGNDFSTVCAEVEARFLEHKLDPLFFSAGHSIGIQTEEIWITRDSTRKIQENMIFNIELYSPLKTGVYVGTEDTFLVKSSGGERLSRLPHEVVAVR